MLTMSKGSSCVPYFLMQIYIRKGKHVFFVLFSRVPGLAFRNQRPYLELQRLELLRLASTEIQTQFFQVLLFF